MVRALYVAVVLSLSIPSRRTRYARLSPLRRRVRRVRR